MISNVTINQYNIEGNLNSSQYENDPLNIGRELSDSNYLVSSESASNGTLLKPEDHSKEKNEIFKKLWTASAIILSIYSCYFIPFFMAFYYTNRPVSFILVDFFVDLFFTADFVLSFLTKKKVPLKATFKTFKKMLKANLGSTFLIDFFSSFPIDKLLLVLYGINHWAVIMIELFKIFRVRRISLLAQRHFNIYLRLLKFVILFTLLLHVAGCIWFIIVRQNQNWIPYQELISGQTVLYSAELWHMYTICLYQGIWLIYGQELAPRSLLEIWTSCFSLVIGMLITTYLFGEMLITFSRLNLRFRVKEKALRYCLSITNKFEFSQKLKKKIIDYSSNVHPTLGSKEEFEKLFKYISPDLQREVLGFIFRPVIQTNRVFQNHSNLSEFMIGRFRYQFYLPDEIIIIEGTKASDFYVISKGICSVFIKNKAGKKAKIGLMKEGTQFGEIGMVYKTYRTATVVSHGYATVANLTKREFRVISNVFPEVIDKLKSMIQVYNDPWKTFIMTTLIQSPAFESLPGPGLQELLYNMKVVVVPRGDFLFKTGELVKGVYLVANGNFVLTVGLENDKKSQVSDSEVKPLDLQENESDFYTEKSKKKSNKGKIDFVKIYSEHIEEDSVRQSSELEIGNLPQGSLVYPNTGLMKGVFHKLNCQSSENSKVLLIDHNMIALLSREYEKFKDIQKQQKKPDFFDLLNPDSLQSNPKFLFKSSVVKIIFQNRENRKVKNQKFKTMVSLLKAVTACEKAGNHKLAEMVLKGKVGFKFITASGSLDPAFLYEGSLPSSHPVLQSFSQITDSNHKSSLIKQCNSLQHEVKHLYPKTKTIKSRISNSIGLMTTLLNQLSK